MYNIFHNFRDRKRKKFVSTGGSEVKKLKTEHGSYIKASYKSNRFDCVFASFVYETMSILVS